MRIELVGYHAKKVRIARPRNGRGDLIAAPPAIGQRPKLVIGEICLDRLAVGAQVPGRKRRSVRQDSLVKCQSRSALRQLLIDQGTRRLVRERAELPFALPLGQDAQDIEPQHILIRSPGGIRSSPHICVRRLAAVNPGSRRDSRSHRGPGFAVGVKPILAQRRGGNRHDLRRVCWPVTGDPFKDDNTRWPYGKGLLDHSKRRAIARIAVFNRDKNQSFGAGGVDQNEGVGGLRIPQNGGPGGKSGRLWRNNPGRRATAEDRKDKPE